MLMQLTVNICGPRGEIKPSFTSCLNQPWNTRQVAQAFCASISLSEYNTKNTAMYFRGSGRVIICRRIAAEDQHTVSHVVKGTSHFLPLSGFVFIFFLTGNKFLYALWSVARSPLHSTKKEPRSCFSSSPKQGLNTGYYICMVSFKVIWYGDIEGPMLRNQGV